MTRTRVFLPLGSLLFLSLVVVVTPAAGQGRKWEIEVHGGGMLATTPTDGTATLPAAGTPFTVPAAPASRRESSWYFGDGAVLVNHVNTARGVTAKITALDPVLNSSVAQRQDGGSFGFRASRHINPRYTVEFGFDYSRGQLEMSDAGLAGIEASRASFISAFNVIVPPGGLGMTPVVTVTSAATIHHSKVHQTFTTGALDINLKMDGKIIPYVTIGGGIVVNSDDTPSATLAGNYLVAGSPSSPLAAFFAMTKRTR